MGDPAYLTRKEAVFVLRIWEGIEGHAAQSKRPQLKKVAAVERCAHRRVILSDMVGYGKSVLGFRVIRVCLTQVEKFAINTVAVDVRFYCLQVKPRGFIHFGNQFD